MSPKFVVFSPLLMASGCAEDETAADQGAKVTSDDDADDDGGANSTSPEAGTEEFDALDFDVFWNASGCGIHSEVLNAREVRIIDDAEDLDETLALATMDQVSPRVDFEGEVVALVVLGNWDCSDYVPVTAVREFEDRVQVEWTHQTRCYDDDGICSPCSFTVVPRRDKPYEFIHRVEYASTCPDGYPVPGE